MSHILKVVPLVRSKQLPALDRNRILSMLSRFAHRGIAYLPLLLGFEPPG
jgi:hypothetical protein